MTKPIHFASPTSFDKHIFRDACGVMRWSFWPKDGLPARLTHNPDRVTCKRCQQTTAYKTAKGYNG